MKKAYITPDTIIIRVQTGTFLSGSLNIYEDSGYGTFYEDPAEDDAMAPEQEDWDIWNEDEYYYDDIIL